MGIKRFADVDWMEFILRELDAGHLFNHTIAGKGLAGKETAPFLRARDEIGLQRDQLGAVQNASPPFERTITKVSLLRGFTLLSILARVFFLFLFFL